MKTPDLGLLNYRIDELKIKLLILKEKIASLVEESKSAEREILALERARDELINHSRVDANEPLFATISDPGVVNRVTRTRGRRLGVLPGSIKEAALKALDPANDGLLALDVLRTINEGRDVPISRTSLSPQLSRLGQAGLVTQQDSIWRITALGRDALAQAVTAHDR